MTVMRYFITALCGLLAFSGNAQLLEDDTKVLNKIQGEAIFSLKAEQAIFTYDPEDGWFKIRKEIYVDPAMVVDNKVISSGAKLVNKQGDEIGQTLAEIKVKEGEVITAYRSDDRFRAIIEGYVFKTKIKDDTRPEDIISSLLAEKSRTVKEEGFKEFFLEYKFEERKFEDLTAYAYKEQNKTLSEDPDFRVIVVFRGAGNPYAVITNAQTVTAPKPKAVWEDGSYKAIYFYKPTAAQAELIQDKILFTFMGL